MAPPCFLGSACAVCGSVVGAFTVPMCYRCIVRDEVASDGSLLGFYRHLHETGTSGSWHLLDGLFMTMGAPIG